MLKKTISVLFLFFITILSFGCSPGQRALQVKGSDTMVNLAQSWVEDFMKIEKDFPVAVTGGGSGTGVASLINKSADIALCSREMKKKEIKEAQRRGVYPHEINVADDGIAVVVNVKNPISKISVEELSDIFSGKAKTWDKFGGKKNRITALSRDRNSGTHIFFLEEVVKLGKKAKEREFANNVLMLPSNQAIVEEVISNKNAIGYIGLGYLNNKIKALAVSKTKSGEYFLPTEKTISTKKYPVSRAMYFYTNGIPDKRVKLFVDFVLSKEGQHIVKTMDFIPVKEHAKKNN